MNVRLRLGTILAATLLALLPSPAEACSCGGILPSSAAFRASAVVFVGTVERVDRADPWSRRNSDGFISGDVGSGPHIVTFAVTKAFRGVAETRILIKNGRCDAPLIPEQTWLVYASEEQGGITTDACSRTRLRSEADEDLKYLEGLAVGSPQGLVYGNVFQQVVGTDGEPAQRALFEVLQVVAVGTAGRFVVTTDRWGPYQVVLPPGDFEMWVERAGRPVTSPLSLQVNNGDELRISFSARFR